MSSILSKFLFENTFCLLLDFLYFLWLPVLVELYLNCLLLEVLLILHIPLHFIPIFIVFFQFLLNLHLSFQTLQGFLLLYKHKINHHNWLEKFNKNTQKSQKLTSTCLVRVLLISFRFLFALCWRVIYCNSVSCGPKLIFGSVVINGFCLICYFWLA